MESAYDLFDEQDEKNDSDDRYGARVHADEGERSKGRVGSRRGAGDIRLHHEIRRCLNSV